MKQTVFLHEKAGLCKGGVMKSWGCFDINNVAQPSPVCSRVMGILNDMKTGKINAITRVRSHRLRVWMWG